ncbi:MAG: lmo0937 family membrane protein [Flavobacteriales bacterium]|jgi:hypothetical protein|uniref:lmo0937 family membrane protein n=1 Tax=Candidatus Ulvibacter alkanivorans TaxID=2267620 RepID=UPI000DF307F2|nr:lmo0937 family membrane protein [Candidatus Ulvibacter alkanivorans]MCH2489462.1 lmo0937 family membrane protein [Flavobacteriales bacterium]
MSRLFLIAIVAVLILWGVGFFYYDLGFGIHALLILAGILIVFKLFQEEMIRFRRRNK